MARTLLGGQLVERHESPGIGDMHDELQDLEKRMAEINNQLGTLGVDIQIKEAQLARNRSHYSPAEFRAVSATLADWRERRATLIEEREILVKQVVTARGRILNQQRQDEKEIAAAGEADLLPLAQKLLKAFNAFCEADDEFKAMKSSFTRPRNTWPSSCIALNSFQRSHFRQGLESFIRKGK